MFTTIITFVLVLGFLVLVHELGHFMAAKAFGVRVNKFAIGFPPRLFSIKKGDTEYCINLIPLGGYVSIKGESGDCKTDSDSFAHKPIWQRCIILSAGVAMNFISAVLMIAIGFSVGLPLPLDDEAAMSRHAHVRDKNIQIFEVLESSPAADAGIQMGDIILSISGTKFKDIDGIQAYLRSQPDRALAFEIRRGREIFTKNVTTVKLEEIDNYGVGVALVQSGLVSYPFHIAVIGAVKKTSAMVWMILGAFGLLIKSLVAGSGPGMPVAGPVGIAVITGQVSRLGFIYLMQFAAILSINLAIINILPFPALDGGRIFLLLLEKFRGRAINQKIEAWIHTIGFSFLMLLMVVVTYRDIIRYGGKFFNAVSSIFS